jgi:hypothetical protein
MRYDSYRYLYPPRPETAIDPLLIPRYADWWAQIKMNGTSNILHVSPDREIIAKSRHPDKNGGNHKAWHVSVNTRQAFLDLPGNGWYVFTAELLHSKVRGLRDINFIHDILVADGEYLVGTIFAYRQNLLRELFPERSQAVTGGHYVIDPHTWLANNYERDFPKLFAGLTAPEHEGLVFKDPNAKLAPCGSERANAAWLRKVRRPSKAYAF